ncbi:mitochondrial carrier [Serendipita vermifera]|nr:mitochondrial carrier [Serendipita vermifera]
MTTSQPAQKHEPLSLFTKDSLMSFISGGTAGAASRTVVSPLERLKIIQQVQGASGSSGQYNGVWRSLVRMWKEEGFKGYMRGNGVNCLRIVPYSAVQFTTYEQVKKWITHHGFELNTPTRLAAGATAGIVSVTATYPLDLVRARLSVASASFERLHNSQTAKLAAASASASSTTTSAASGATATAPSASTIAATSTVNPLRTNVVSGSVSAAAKSIHTSISAGASAAASAAAAVRAPPPIPGVWAMTLKVMREEGGVRALYRGLVPTALGVAPYNGINFAAYELFKATICPPDKQTTPRRLLTGALAGTISQTLTYPLDVLRRKSQMASAKGFKQYNGAIDAARKTFQYEGVAGLYRGMWPNLIKVAPAMATSFYVYETVKAQLKLWL